jgi:hypothetical protein
MWLYMMEQCVEGNDGRDSRPDDHYVIYSLLVETTQFDFRTRKPYLPSRCSGSLPRASNYFSLNRHLSHDNSPRPPNSAIMPTHRYIGSLNVKHGVQSIGRLYFEALDAVYKVTELAGFSLSSVVSSQIRTRCWYGSCLSPFPVAGLKNTRCI